MTIQKLIKNCHIISPDLELNCASIEIYDKFITRIYEQDDTDRLPNADFIYDAKFNMVIPGFIDIHTHGLCGFDISDVSAHSILNIAKNKLREGVTTFAPTTLSLTKNQLIQATTAVSKYKKDTKYAKIAGIHLEGPFINPDYSGAHNKDYIRLPNIEEVLNINKISKVSIVSFSIELDENFKFLRGLVESGIVPSCAHSGATYRQFMAAKHLGLKNLTHFCNQMTELHHREIGLIGSGLLDNDIFIEIICDNIHICPEMIELIFKVKPIEKITLITDSISASWCADGMFAIGGLDVKVENGIARLASNNALAGSTLRFYNALKNVSDITKLPLTQLVKTTSQNQANLLKLPKLGKLEPGYIADITIVDNSFYPQAVFVDGEKLI